MNTSVRCPLQSGEEGAMLLSYVDRQLDAGTMAALDRHVAACPDCARVVDAQRAVWRALASWEPIAASADFDDRVLARVREEEQRGEAWWRRLLAAPLFHWKPAVPLAAACAVLIGVSVWRLPGERTALGQQSVAIDSAEATQVEEALSDVEMLRQLGVTEEKL